MYSAQLSYSVLIAPVSAIHNAMRNEIFMVVLYMYGFRAHTHLYTLAAVLYISGKNRELVNQQSK